MTYFAEWPPWAARLLLAAMAVLIVLGAVLKPVPRMGPPPPPREYDQQLYSDITRRVTAGENYYAATASEMRAHGYTMTPAYVFREPALAWVNAGLRTDARRQWALVALSLAVFIALRNALARSGVTPMQRLVALPLLLTGLGVAWFPPAHDMHEIWAGLLIALSLGVWRPDRFHLSVVLGVAACLIREIALPYMLAMAAFAAWERRFRELAEWMSGIVLFAVLFAWHLSIASTLYKPGDLVAGAWVTVSGWAFVLETAKRNVILAFTPNAITAAVACAALIGFAGTRDRWISRAGFIVGGYMASFLIFGRPGNAYWGQLYAPLFPIGLVLAPAAFRDLVIAAYAGAIPQAVRNFARPVATRTGKEAGRS